MLEIDLKRLRQIRETELPHAYATSNLKKLVELQTEKTTILNSMKLLVKSLGEYVRKEVIRH